MYIWTIGELEVKLEIMTDRPTDRPTDQPTDRRKDRANGTRFTSLTFLYKPDCFTMKISILQRRVFTGKFSIEFLKVYRKTILFKLTGNRKWQTAAPQSNHLIIIVLIFWGSLTYINMHYKNNWGIVDNKIILTPPITQFRCLQCYFIVN